MPRLSLKPSLYTTTALIGAAMIGVGAASKAHAAPVIINGPSGMVTLQNGDEVTVTGTGVITGGTGIYGSGSVIATSITNAGTIDGGSIGIFLQTNATLSNGLTNSGTIDGGTAGIYLQNNASLSNGLTNSGTIDGGSSAGIFLLSNASLADGITNSGTIDGGSVGIYLQTNGSLAGGITNSGTIDGGNTGIFLLNNASLADGITNSGTIDGGNTGIYLSNASLAGGITNSGTIDGDIYGIYLRSNSGLSGGLTNSGIVNGGTTGVRLQNNAVLSDGFINSGTVAGGVHAGLALHDTASLSGGLTNSGLMSGINEAIFIGESAIISGGLTNSGTLSANAGINIVGSAQLIGGLTNSGTIIGNGLYGVFMNGTTLDGGITNSGTVSADYGFYANSSASITGGLANSGLIEGDLFSFLLRSSSTLTGGLTNTGTMAGDSLGLVLQISSSISGGVTNSGLISGGSNSGVRMTLGSQIIGGFTNSGTIDGGITIDNAAAIDSIILSGNNARIIGNVTDDAPADGSDVTVNGNFTTEGNFSVSSLTVNNGRTLTLDVGDAFTSYNDAAINGTLTFNVTDAANFGALVVSNGTANLTNGTLTVGVIGAGLVHNDEIRVINANSALVGGPGGTETLIADNSFLWDFYGFDGTQATAATDNTDLFIRAVAVSNAETSATTPNNVAVAAVIDSFSGSDSPELMSIVQNLNNAPTQQAVNDILESTTPTIDTAISDAASAIAHQSVDLIQARLSDLRAGSGVSSGQLTDALGVWGQVFGQHASQSKRDNIAGYDANTYGFVGGIDTDHLFDNATIGLAVSYGNSAIKSKDANSTRTDINSYQIGLYSDYNLPQDYFISGSVAYGYNDIQSVRRDVGGIAGLTATGDYSADQYTAHIETGKDFQIKPAGAPTITPTIGATYTHLSPVSV